MGQATAPAAGQPMGDLNTTPLIDVMLVLLVMFIITIPVATHSIEVDLPLPCGTDCPDLPTPDAVKNKIVLDDQNQILWNGTAVTEQQMAALLIQTTQMDVEPELQFEPTANASYALAARTLDTIKSVGVSKFGFVGNERYRQFASAEEDS
ncbi:biopolymer transporter ExbD [Pontixanthobacter aestiaquae]|uniref:Biopolymer transporter ExbD n=1 Tax=Pontixanthobacter aestiaquae TaxID=1509367 RepID=A0A844Z4G0_9SPHN|nr:biopolymer transporter ExbD [Pontixanthobacter aestiaquae]MDN3647035.1 biopolymer transporter ExbD [Pontixanthobacter aestiaquae]MXO81987.1 biopolymer transporter ExbD [Pontixanthobacter aestiaquae]